MPTIREYRIVLPMSLEEFERARRWHKVEQIKLEKKFLEDDTVKVSDFGERTLLREKIQTVPNTYVKLNGNPVEHVIKGYESTVPNSAPFTFLTRIGSLMDVFVSKSMRLTEVESWEAYPYFRTVSTNSSLSSSYQMTIEVICVPGNETKENALHLPKNILKEREVVSIDIARNVDNDDYRDGKDPILFRSEKTGRGPLIPGDWMKEVKPCITCYILVSIHFDILGPLGSLAERTLHKGIFRAMTLHHRELFCYIDEWIDFSLEDLQEEEKKLQEELENLVETKLKLVSPPDDVAAKIKAEQEKPFAEEGAESVPKTGCCPVESVKGIFQKCCASTNGGCSMGCSSMMLGLFFTLLAFLFAIFSQYIFL